MAPVPGGAEFKLRVSPGAARDRVLGVDGGALRLEVRAPARGGRANRAVLNLLASFLGLEEDRLTIRRGVTAPGKWVHVAGMHADELSQHLARTLLPG
ncbi:MAG: DUF167 domain-containing protein [bacterium]|nr:DUF167 domain-containing protein [bacterium]